jgi:hypothetical protein
MRLYLRRNIALLILGYAYFLLFPLWRLIEGYIDLPGIKMFGLPLLTTRNLLEILIFSIFLFISPRLKIYRRDRILLFTYFVWFYFVLLKALFAPIITYGVAQLVFISQWLSVVGVAMIFSQQPIVIRLRMLIFFVLGVIISIFFSYYQLYAGNIFYGGRLTYSATANPTTLSAYICLSIIILIFIYSFSKYKASIQIVLTFLILSLLLTQGRNSILAICLSGLFVFFGTVMVQTRGVYSNLNRLIFNFLLLLSLLFASTFVLPIIFDNFDFNAMTYRIALLWSAVDANEVTAGRIDIWIHYWDLIFNSDLMRFFLGFGPGLSSHEEWLPHNSYLSIFFEHGILGLSIFLIVLSVNLLRFINLKHAPNRYAIFIVLYIALLMFGNDYSYSLLWVVLSLAIMVGGDQAPKVPEENNRV